MKKIICKREPRDPDDGGDHAGSRRGKRGGVKGVDGVNNLEREIRKTVKDMLWLADAKVNEEADHDAVRSYRQGYADALRQWAKTIELRLLKKKSPTAKAAEQNK